MFKNFRKIKKFVSVFDISNVANLKTYDDFSQHFDYNSNDMNIVNVQIKKREFFSSMSVFMKH